MDENKIALIIYKTSDTPADSIKQMLSGLTVPEGFRPTASIVSGPNRWRAYNQAMKASDAKYKIYLDEQVEMLNNNILVDLVEIFRSDQSVGMIGCCGSLELSTHAISYRSAKRCGKVIIGQKKVNGNWQQSDARFQEVEVLDGFLLATQYDIDWRDDLFEENSYGDFAQSIEFRRRGYKCVVARQENPWIWYRSDSMPFHEPARKKFLAEYSKELFPLVQILIPTFNRPQFFPVALESAMNQTYRNIEIIISDDSTNDHTYAVVQPYLSRDNRIQYFRNPGFTSADNNRFLQKKMWERTEAEYFSWLFDDDMFYPTKIEKMIEAYRNNPDVSLVSSRRHNIDENGNVLGEMEPLHQKTEKLSGEAIGKFLLMYTANRIGEPSTVLLKKKFLVDEDKKHWRRRPDMLDSPNALGDYSQWLYLLERGDIFWINEVLSARRMHAGQDSQQIDTWVQIYVNFAEEVNEFWRRKKFITTNEELRHTIIVWLTKAAGALQRAFLDHYRGAETDMMERVIPAMVLALSNGGNIKFPSWSEVKRKEQSH
ncbi:MAG: glycosyltransferase [Selenomonadaceae bacterium]|nr:glycosyltransferase [Selenomonadaceae bacterium]